MLEFTSASARVINSRRAIAECVEILGGSPELDCRLLMIHASVGHDFGELAAEARRLAPGATIVGASCCGVIGREGVSETMKDVAVMAVKGEEVNAVHVDHVFGHNSLEKSRELALEIRRTLPGVNMVYFLASGIDIANDECIRAIEEILGPEVTVFGATSADNMRGLTSYQIFDAGVYEHSAWLVGFADPSLKVVTGASHGFVAVGEALWVTKAEGNRIFELNGRPAWLEYTERLGLNSDAHCGDTIPIGALAERLDESLAAEYGNSHILRVVTSRDGGGTMLYATTIREGTPLWLTVRDEDRIFADMDRMTSRITAEAGNGKPVAVFHADCLARGRHLFNRILKEELVSRMQAPFSVDGEVPPWIGMYGFGEFARLGGRNEYHNYTSAVYALYRCESGS
jgi:hypothetical protein